MVQKSGEKTTWDVKKSVEKNGMNYQPQEVSLPDFGTTNSRDRTPATCEKKRLFDDLKLPSWKFNRPFLCPFQEHSSSIAGRLHLLMFISLLSINGDTKKL